MIKILANNIGISKISGYFLSEEGVIDTNLQYIGYIVHKRNREHFDAKIKLKENEYLINFYVDWQGEFFECDTPTHKMALIYNQCLIKHNDIMYNINNFTYINHDNYLLKIPNNVNVMWVNNLINQYNTLYIHFLIKSISLPELKRKDYNNYKLINNIVTSDVKALAKHCFQFDL